MTGVWFAALLLASPVQAGGFQASLPSCDLRAQHQVTGTLGGQITDPRQAHISVRANVLQADIGTARIARRLSQAEAQRLWRRVQTVRQDANALTHQQGFLSAAERASYDRALDAAAMRLCR